MGIYRLSCFCSFFLLSSMPFPKKIEEKCNFFGENFADTKMFPIFALAKQQWCGSSVG